MVVRATVLYWAFSITELILPDLILNGRALLFSSPRSGGGGPRP